LFDLLVIKKWVPDPSEIFIDSLPIGKSPPAKKDGQYLCSLTLTVAEVMKVPRKDQIEIFTKLLETIETIAKIQQATFKRVFAIRYNNANGHQVMSFFAYFPKKFVKLRGSLEMSYV